MLCCPQEVDQGARDPQEEDCFGGTGSGASRQGYRHILLRLPGGRGGCFLHHCPMRRSTTSRRWHRLSFKAPRCHHFPKRAIFSLCLEVAECLSVCRTLSSPTSATAVKVTTLVVYPVIMFRSVSLCKFVRPLHLVRFVSPLLPLSPLVPLVRLIILVLE